MDSPHLEETIPDTGETREQTDLPHQRETTPDTGEVSGQMDSPHLGEIFLDLAEASNTHSKQKEEETRDIETHVTPALMMNSLKIMDPNCL